jgi:glutamyl-tRNA reductase
MASPDPQIEPLLDCLAHVHGVPRSEFEPYLYHLIDDQAIHQLFRVAAGLDSQVLGESQILGQVSHALDLASRQGAAGRLTTRLFQAAISAGKRAHTETHIGQNPVSIPSMAARLVEHAVPHLDKSQVIVIGAGEMAQLVIAALRKRSTCDILVVNRSLARARELARPWGPRRPHLSTWKGP